MASRGTKGQTRQQKKRQDGDSPMDIEGRMGEAITTATAPRPVQQRLLRTAVESKIREAINTLWEHDWQTSLHGRAVYELTPAPTKQVLKMHRGLHRALSTVIIQMRTGKIGLRHYLYQRGVPDIPDRDCRCGKATQTVQHILLACPIFKDLREQFLGKPGGGLEGGGNLRTILNMPNLAVIAAKFTL